jgi:Fe-Mn family superoxide dismutase
MSTFNRRNFLFVSSGAAAGSLLVPGVASCAEETGFDFASSGLATGVPKPLKHSSIPGFLSPEQMAPHHTAHYGGALKTFVSIEDQIEASFLQEKAIDPQAFESMQRTKSSRGNSVVLHELYFDGLAPKAPDPSEGVRAAIEKRFGSIHQWQNDFIASAKSAAGWAILVHHPVNGRLYNVVSDEHAMGPLWMASPLVALDVYEHAFYIDYQNRKAEYIEKYFDHIDWQEVERRYRVATTAYS